MNFRQFLAIEGVIIEAGEYNKWAKDIKIDKNKMHELLGVPLDKKISVVYTSAEKLVNDLIKQQVVKKKHPV